MRSFVRALFVVCAVLVTRDVPASERSTPASAQASATKVVAKPSTAPAAAATAAPAPHQETLDEIVARVRRRLAMETPRRPAVKSVATPPPPPASTRRVTLVWRPTVVWPDELAPSPASSTAIEPGR